MKWNNDFSQYKTDVRCILRECERERVEEYSRGTEGSVAGATPPGTGPGGTPRRAGVTGKGAIGIRQVTDISYGWTQLMDTEQLY